MTLGQLTAHRMNFINQTKSKEFPAGVAYKALALMKQRYAPDDLGAEIMFENEMELVHFSNAGDYYNEVVSICNKYEVNWDNTRHLKTLLKKTNNHQFIKLIMDHLKSNPADDFEAVRS